MKFSEQWLREWVNPAISTEALSEQLSMAGLEVDGVEPVAGEFTNVVVGQVVECGQHPNADKLQVTKVDTGDGELHDIVCGAKNCRLGIKVFVAKVGAVLPGNFKIKKTKLRGEPSNGMLCSESELGLADSSPGIMELPEDAPVGQCAREYLKLDDVSIDVDLTPNRSDCLGMLGLAREVGVLNNMPVLQPEEKHIQPSIDDTLPIQLDAPEACPRYLGRVIRDINPTATTPLWMMEKLRRSGVRAIDPVVDVTNYVLLELGHPMHAFDLDQLEGGIVVRYSRPQESLTLLDGNTVELNENTLLIADEKKAVAMAGIFGGEGTGVTESSHNIFLESAFFAPTAIAGKARSYGLHTDASHRYERGVDPQLQRRAMERATELLLDIVGGEAGPVTEAVSGAHIPADKTVELRHARIAHVLGVSLPEARIEEIMQCLGFSLKANENGWSVLVPAYRFDISIEEDLIEEVARVYGYNNIPNTAPVASLTMTRQQEARVNIYAFSQTLISRGFQEVITYSFVDPKAQSRLHPSIPSITLPHPISADMSVMRVSLFPGLIQTVVYNQKRQQPRVRLFEQGLRYIQDENAENGVRQERVLSGIIAGTINDEHWGMEARPVDYFDLKGDVEAILAKTNDLNSFEFVAEEHESLHPGQSASIYRNNEKVGLIGSVHPEHERKLGLHGRTFVFELDLDKIEQRQLPVSESVSKFPANRRDIALIVDENVAAGQVLSAIRKVGGNQLVDLKLFDIYTGQGIEPGQKSLAIALTLQDKERTLEEKDINDVVDRVVESMSEQFKASLRD
ncbi:phenylalanine--tRNA ligase subunit beta [Algicola sagamiensis]|uniref:phenylalanine--tRNA ligase subunit beta n=1 Tax=Algicola sagamiensis TaxID=163869 RepID=UPI000361C38C|nr:phenylalanine--tRNA ligase subunit beta [Algicola sagamiensis]